MTEAQDAPEVTEVTPVEPYESEGARYLRVRQEAKAEAKVTIEKNVKEALKAKKKAQAQRPTIEGQKDFYAEAAAIEKSINATDDKKEA